jgi:hypothetical protein
MSTTWDASTATEAAHRLARRDGALPALPLLLDGEAMSEALGSRVRIERLRYKPGTSLVAAVRDDAGGCRWLVTHVDEAKLAKHARRAGRAGAAARRIGEHVVVGPAFADRALAAAVSGFFGGEASVLGGAQIVRYNPLRRLVVRAGDRAIKFATSEPPSAIAGRLAAAGVPVAVPQRLGAGASATQWWGSGDLSSGQDATLTAMAGRALAALHAARVGATRRGPAPAEVAAEAASAVGSLLPELRGRAQALAARIPSLLAFGSGTVLAHGDFAPDQVLVDGRDIRIIDLDRVASAPPERDLGSFLARGGEASLVDGYRQAGGRVTDRALAAWRALAHLQRAVEPFRRAEADWPEGVAAEIAAAEEVLG